MDLTYILNLIPGVRNEKNAKCKSHFFNQGRGKGKKKMQTQDLWSMRRPKK